MISHITSSCFLAYFLDWQGPIYRPKTKSTLCPLPSLNHVFPLQRCTNFYSSRTLFLALFFCVFFIYLIQWTSIIPLWFLFLLFYYHFPVLSFPFPGFPPDDTDRYPPPPRGGHIFQYIHEDVLARPVLPEACRSSRCPSCRACRAYSPGSGRQSSSQHRKWDTVKTPTPHSVSLLAQFRLLY
jgi:hypothetical protein